MNYRESYEKWMSFNFLDEDLKKELLNMKNDEEKIKDCFYDYLPFGTGGARGLMGVGTNRFNVLTVRRISQGFSNFLIASGEKEKGIVITYDSRINSEKFALTAALNFCANGIKTYMFKGIRPTPFLSFAIRNLNAAGGVNITASHNSKEYNGYKLYLSDGAQFSYPDDEKIINYINKIDDISSCKTIDKKEAIKNKLLIYLDDKLDKKFEKEAMSKIINRKFVSRHGKDLKIVYTPLHGTGSVFLKNAIKNAGFKNCYIVKEQDDKNGEFKTVKYPNPESKDAFKMALNLAKEKNADIVVATDPDADRLGVYVKSNDKYIPLTGNELSSIILEYILHFSAKKNLNDYYVVKSFVTTRLIDAICKRYNIELKTTLTGFKWIGKEILNSKKKFLFGAEESYGFLVDDYVRDKDAISATLMTLEIALLFKKAHVNMADVLGFMQSYYGVYRNYNVSIDFKGVDGIDKMKSIMNNLRNNPVNKITDIDVLVIDDYINSTSKNLKDGNKESLKLPKNDTLVLHLADDTNITIRPSGTEPKIKIYYDILDKTIELADNKYEILNSAFMKIIKGEGN